MHVGIDIQARDGAGVYAMQPGYAHILQGSGFDARVQVGNFIYWHIVPRVFEGQYVFAYSTSSARSSGTSATCTSPTSPATSTATRCARAAAC